MLICRMLGHKFPKPTIRVGLFYLRQKLAFHCLRCNTSYREAMGWH